MKTFASLFSGCGGADQGARQAGFKHMWGVELCAKPAAIAKANGFELYVENVCHSDFSDRGKYPCPDWLHVSPPCQNASLANHKSGETSSDRILANAIAGAIVDLKPNHFSLENVSGYRYFESFKYILEILNGLDYSIWIGILNAADYGVPQTRKRLFAIASKESQAIPPMPSHQEENSQGSLFYEPWQGWSNALVHVHTASENHALSDRMVSMLPKGNFERSLFTGFKDSQRSLTRRMPTEPAPTLLATMDRPSLLPWVCSRNAGILKASCITVKGMAALQGFPLSYEWGRDLPAARKAIGNSVCPPVMEALIKYAD